jgi:hypothetical protein
MRESIEWVDVKTRMPDEESTVIICNKARREVATAFLHAGEFHSLDSNLSDVTHWAELPKGPR